MKKERRATVILRRGVQKIGSGKWEELEQLEKNGRSSKGAMYRKYKGSFRGSGQAVWVWVKRLAIAMCPLAWWGAGLCARLGLGLGSDPTDEGACCRG